jgi:hypothetical protein
MRIAEMRISVVLLALGVVSGVITGGAQVTPRSVRAESKPAVSPDLPNPAKALKIAPQTFTDLEKHFDNKLATRYGANDPIDLLGATRGIYLDGYGAVFTTEASLIVTPNVNPFHREITKEERARVHQRKLARLPVLKQVMTEMMKSAGLMLIQIPDNQQIVLAVRLLYLPYEDTTGLPAQVMMSASRNDARNGDIKTEEQ